MTTIEASRDYPFLSLGGDGDFYRSMRSMLIHQESSQRRIARHIAATDIFFSGDVRFLGPSNVSEMAVRQAAFEELRLERFGPRAK